MSVAQWAKMTKQYGAGSILKYVNPSINAEETFQASPQQKVNLPSVEKAGSVYAPGLQSTNPLKWSPKRGVGLLQQATQESMEVPRLVSQHQGAGPAVTAQVTRYGYKGDPRMNSNDAKGIGNRNNRLKDGSSVALNPEVAKELGINLKGNEYVEAKIGGQWQRFRVDDTTAKGLENHRIDFYDPSGRRTKLDGSMVQIRKASQPVQRRGGSSFANAAKYQGTKEGKNTKRIESWLKSVDKSLKGDKTAWCSAFCNVVAKESGLEATNKLNARSWLNVGQKISGTASAKQGDVVIISRGNKNSWTGHVGFFAGTDSKGNIKILGGNQSDSVNVSTYDKNRLLGIRRLRPI